MNRAGITPDQLDPSKNTTFKLNVIPCLESNRRPCIEDRKYPILTIWLVNLGDSKGEVWQLTTFDIQGNAVWKKINYSINESNFLYIEAEKEKVYPNAYGYINLSANCVKNRAKVIKFVGDKSEISLDLQQATSLKQSPDCSDFAGVCSFDDLYFKVDENGHVTLKEGLGTNVKGFLVEKNYHDKDSKALPDEVGFINLKAEIFKNDGSKPPVYISNHGTNAIEINFQVASTCNSKDTNFKNTGMASFNEVHFDVNEYGNVSLARAKHLPINRIEDSAKNTLIEPSAEGILRFEGTCVKFKAKPVDTRGTDNKLLIEIQGAGYFNKESNNNLQNSGLINVAPDDFNLSKDATLSLKNPCPPNIGIYGLGLKVEGNKLVICKSDGTDLSNENSGYVVTSVGLEGYLKTVKVTENYVFDFDKIKVYDFQLKANDFSNYRIFIYALYNYRKKRIDFCLSLYPFHKRYLCNYTLFQEGYSLHFNKNVISETNHQMLLFASLAPQIEVDEYFIINQYADLTVYKNASIEIAQKQFIKKKYFYSELGIVPEWKINNYFYYLKDGKCFVSFYFHKLQTYGLGLCALNLVLPFKSKLSFIEIIKGKWFIENNAILKQGFFKNLAGKAGVQLQTYDKEILCNCDFTQDVDFYGEFSYRI